MLPVVSTPPLPGYTKTSASPEPQDKTVFDVCYTEAKPSDGKSRVKMALQTVTDKMLHL